jgi:hypothetical protein
VPSGIRRDRFAPGAPGCFPCRRPAARVAARRSARDWRGFCRSADGGFDEFSEFLDNSASRCATRSTNAVFNASNSAFLVANSASLAANSAIRSAIPTAHGLTHIARSVVDRPAPREEDLTGYLSLWLAPARNSPSPAAADRPSTPTPDGPGGSAPRPGSARSWPSRLARCESDNVGDRRHLEDSMRVIGRLTSREHQKGHESMLNA